MVGRAAASGQPGSVARSNERRGVAQNRSPLETTSARFFSVKGEDISSASAATTSVSVVIVVVVIVVVIVVDVLVLLFAMRAQNYFF